MIVLKKNVAKKVDFLIGMSEKVATRSRVQRLNKPSKDDILRGFPLKQSGGIRAQKEFMKPTFRLADYLMKYLSLSQVCVFQVLSDETTIWCSEDMAAKELVRGSRQIDFLMKLNRLRRYFMSLSLEWKSSLGVNKIPNS